VRDFSFDTKFELEKILEVTNRASDLNLYLRIAISKEHAETDLSKNYQTLSYTSMFLVYLCH
jgi:ornithine decarboxylase